MKDIYLDYAAATPLDHEVLKEMQPYFTEKFGNPSSINAKGTEARDAVEHARQRISKILHCKSSEILFTSGGTESVNLALQGISHAYKDKGKHIVTTKIEHESVLQTLNYLEREEGFHVTYLPVDSNGLIDPMKLEKAVQKDTILITVIYANNEIGTIQNLATIGEIAKKYNIPFHTDACQAAGFCELDVNTLRVDLLSLNGSKIYGPKGVGILYKRASVRIKPLLHGGGQEFFLRSGTENVPGIIGFAKALELAEQHKEKETLRLIQLYSYFLQQLQKKIPGVFLNGHSQQRLPNNLNVSFDGIEGESLILLLNEKGIYASVGSACSSKSVEPSTVLRAIGVPEKRARGAIRFSLGNDTTNEHIDYVLQVLPGLVENLLAINARK